MKSNEIPAAQSLIAALDLTGRVFTLDAKTFAGAIRNHWAIENREHWVRDVTLAEDACRIRCNPTFMARLLSQALNIARANGVTNIVKTFWAAAIDPVVWVIQGDGT